MLTNLWKFSLKPLVFSGSIPIGYWFKGFRKSRAQSQKSFKYLPVFTYIKGYPKAAGFFRIFYDCTTGIQENQQPFLIEAVSQSIPYHLGNDDLRKFKNHKRSFFKDWFNFIEPNIISDIWWYCLFKMNTT
jgi:hypothetical protein